MHIFKAETIDGVTTCVLTWKSGKTLKQLKKRFPDDDIRKGVAENGQIEVDGKFVNPKPSVDQQVRNVDKASRDRINPGFTFDSKRFSLSKEAQINWIGLLSVVNAGILSLEGQGVSVSTIDDDEYFVTDIAFFAAAFTAVSTILAEGRAEKIAIISGE